MKLDLSKRFVNFDGSPIEGFTLRDIILQYLGTFGSQVGEEVIAAYAIGQKVYTSGNKTIELTDDEHKVVVKSIEKPQHIAIVYAQLSAMLNEEIKGDVERV